MPTFILAGVAYDYLAPTIEGDPEDVRSWKYGKSPKVEAAIPLRPAEPKVYGEASHRGRGHVIVFWLHDEWPSLGMDLAGNVRRLTDSQWDIEEYRKSPPERRPIRWGNRLPGFLPE